MLVITTETVEGRRIVEYLGVVSGDAIVGVNIVRDILAKVRDFVGGRAGGYEKALGGAKRAALDDLAEQARELGADAVIGVDLDYEAIGDSMLMVSANGTAVRLG
jgi:uncharacterized protein YbjQ (UPF0145 family)